MAAPNPLPKFVYKIIPSSPEPLPASFPLSALDAKDGFVHLSTATQVPQTADLFFNHAETLWLVKLELAQLADPIKWEGGFPHLYGNFGAADAHSVTRFERAEGQKWSDVMSTSTWLE